MLNCPSCGCNLTKLGDLAFGNIEIAYPATVRWNGEPVHVSPQEFAILESLVRAQGRVMKHEALCEVIDGSPNVMRKTVCLLRQRFLELDPSFGQIQMQYMVGYNWVYQPAPSSAGVNSETVISLQRAA